jgi:hypothetical protein
MVIGAFSVAPPALPWLRPPMKLWSSSTTPLSSSRSGRTMARRSLCSHAQSVFENDLGELDAAGTLAAAEDNEHALITAETRRLHIAAHWADL